MTDNRYTPPPLPQEIPIPEKLLERWIKLPSNQPISAPITRAEVDNLFFSLQKIINGQARFQEAMIAYTNGNLEEADRLNDLARREMIEANNQAKLFLTGVMSAEILNDRT